MEVQRSTKHRSLGVDTKSQPARTKRPSVGERHKSAPLVARNPQNHVQRATSSAGTRKDIVTKAPNSETSVISAPDHCPIIRFIVIGNVRVGKTTFIRNALDLSKSASAVISSNTVSFHGTRYRIHLHEVDLSDIELIRGQPVKWPKFVGGVAFASVHGVLCLYDVTDEDSIVGVPQTLYALSRSKLPVMLVACKVDAPISEQEVGITFIERVRRSFPLVSFGESSSTSAESAKRCLLVALKATLATKKLNAALAGNPNDNGHPQLMKIRTTDFEQTRTMPANPQTPVSGTDTSHHAASSSVSGLNITVPETPESYHHNNMVRAKTEETADDNFSRAGQTFLETEDDSSNGSSEQLEMHVENVVVEEPARNEAGEAGVSFPDLVDRLLRMPATKNDTKFVPAFLCLYRSFATPKRLLVAMIDRFVLTDQSDLVSLTKVAELLRYLQVLAQWTAKYPGDFAESSTRRLAISFAQDLEQSKNFAPAAREIIGNLLTIIMDDDRDWAYANNEEHGTPDSTKAKRSSIMTDYRRDSTQNVESDNSDNDRDARRRSVRNSGSASTASSIIRSSLASSQSATNLFNLDSAREQSRLLKSIPLIPLTKIQWHQFMSMSTEELAREITRMDWTMYSAIRARDFVRHVNLSSRKRALLKHADTIGMMVKHFNHLALFVSGMILFRDKPKHRAKALEKFMDLAWKVRQLNNYNSLGAIVAGITGPEISRLSQTYELVPNEVKKQFLRLTVLMSISRSHAAYRMAWENSSAERIPFIPLVRQDLTMTANANPTFIGNNINWKKFEIMGDVIVGIQRSHEQPYSFPERTQRSQEMTRLILETKVIEESEDSADPRSELYERSLQLESYMGNESRKSLAAFGVRRTMTGWFQTQP